MNIGRAIQWLEVSVATILAVSTLLFSIFIFVRDQSLNDFHISTYGKSELLFFIGNGYETSLVTIFLFAIIIFITTSWYVSRSGGQLRAKVNNKTVPVSLGFLFIFLVISAVGSFETSAISSEKKMGHLAVALNYGQIVIVFSILLIILTVVFSPLWTGKKGISKSFINGSENLRLPNYSKALIPALVIALIFYIFLNAGLLGAIEFFGIALLLIVFAQRYGIITSLFLLVISLGSNIIGVEFVSFTGIFYPIIVFVFAFIGLIVGFTANVAYQRKTMAGREGGNNTEESTSDYKQAPKNKKVPVMLDSREIADQLFIRGICPNCDSVEFYFKNVGLECKKCKSVWSGKETSFQSFRVGRDAKFRV